MSRPHLRDPKLERFWRTTLTKWTKSRLNIREFCRRHNLGEPAFYFWRREIAARDRSPATNSSRPDSQPESRRSSTPTRPSRPAPTRRSSTPGSRPSFVAVRVVADTPLELVLRSGLVLRVPPGYDAGHLRAVVVALEAEPC